MFVSILVRSHINATFVASALPKEVISRHIGLYTHRIDFNGAYYQSKDYWKDIQIGITYVVGWTIIYLLICTS
jgi:hypothetical protein